MVVGKLRGSAPQSVDGVRMFRARPVLPLVQQKPRSRDRDRKCAKHGFWARRDLPQNPVRGEGVCRHFFLDLQLGYAVVLVSMVDVGELVKENPRQGGVEQVVEPLPSTESCGAPATGWLRSSGHGSAQCMSREAYRT